MASADQPSSLDSANLIAVGWKKGWFWQVGNWAAFCADQVKGSRIPERVDFAENDA